VLCEAGVEKFDAHGIIFHRAKRAGEWITCPQTSPKIAALKDGERILREDVNAQAGTIQELRSALTTAHRERDEAREKVASWMIANSFATGHGDTIDDLLAELSGHIKSERDALKARIAELESAIEPFASFTPVNEEEFRTMDGNIVACIPAGWVRRARALTSPPTPSRGEKS
jgi:hypothetical protein